MCLLVVHRPGAAPLTEDQIRNAWSANDDGAGFAYIHEGALVLRRPFFKLKPLIAAYLEAHRLHGATSPFILHFRWATHGHISADNCHPIPIDGTEAVLAHNGILSCFSSPFKEESDTAFFARTVLASRPCSQLLDPAFGNYLADMIGAGNKLAILSPAAPHVSIINESQGHWLDNTWFSNNSYLPSATSRSPSSYTPTSYCSVNEPAVSGPLRLSDQELEDLAVECAYYEGEADLWVNPLNLCDEDFEVFAAHLVSLLSHTYNTPMPRSKTAIVAEARQFLLDCAVDRAHELEDLARLELEDLADRSSNDDPPFDDARLR